MSTTRTSLKAISLAGAIASLVIIAALCLGGGKAQASPAHFSMGYIAPPAVGLSYDSQTSWWNKFFFSTGGSKLTAAKSSNPKVLKVYNVSKNGMTVETMKPGKATLTYKLNGKKKTVAVVVRKYENPFKVFKVGSRSLASKYAKTCQASLGLKSYPYEISGTVSITPAKNWKIKSLQAYVPGAKSSFKNVKNNSKLPKGTTTVSVIMTNTKTKAWQRAYLYT